jgi:hypothetical protein
MGRLYCPKLGAFWQDGQNDRQFYCKTDNSAQSEVFSFLGAIDKDLLAVASGSGATAICRSGWSPNQPNKIEDADDISLRSTTVREIVRIASFGIAALGTGTVNV